MQYNIYVFLFQLIMYDYKTVNAIIGHNVRITNEGEFPAVACIARYNPNKNWQENMACSGTLITSEFILTAAHCFYTEEYFRYEISLGSYLVEQGERFYPVWWISHDQWASENNETIEGYNDVLLAKIVGVRSHIVPIPVGIIKPSTRLYGSNAAVVGCGRTNDEKFPKTLLASTLTIINREVCTEIVSEIQGWFTNVSELFSCSMGVPWTQLHSGDSGGPLLYDGSIIGINIATCPRLGDNFNKNKLNIHINLSNYQKFFSNVAF